MVQCCSVCLNSKQESFGLLPVFKKQKRDNDCALYKWKIAWKHPNIIDFLFLSVIKQENLIIECGDENLPSLGEGHDCRIVTESV